MNIRKTLKSWRPVNRNLQGKLEKSLKANNLSQQLLTMQCRTITSSIGKMLRFSVKSVMRGLVIFANPYGLGREHPIQWTETRGPTFSVMFMILFWRHHPLLGRHLLAVGREWSWISSEEVHCPVCTKLSNVSQYLVLKNELYLFISIIRVFEIGLWSRHHAEKNNLSEKWAWRGFCKGFLFVCLFVCLFVQLGKILNGHKTFPFRKINKINKK